MKWIFSGMIILSLIVSVCNGSVADVSNAAVGECLKAVELAVTLLGAMCLWSGFMKIVERSGLSDIISRLLSPVTHLLFPSLKRSSAALKAISMNITANLLGLGNAATPLGIAAMTELHKEDGGGNTASKNMVMLVVINTASIQLLPTTIATLRYQAGAAAPLDVLLPILLSSLISVTVGILSVKLFYPQSKNVGGRTHVK